MAKSGSENYVSENEDELEQAPRSGIDGATQGDGSQGGSQYCLKKIDRVPDTLANVCFPFGSVGRHCIDRCGVW